MTHESSSQGGGIALSAVTFMIWTGVTASAETETSDAQESVQAIDAVAGAVRSDVIDVSSADSTVSVGGVVSVDLSSDASDGISIDSPTAGDLEIGLPFADTAGDAQVVDGVMVYDNGNGSSTTPLVHADGSVQILTTIADANAPTAYEYQFDLAAGAVLTVTGDGGVDIVEADGSVSRSIAAPWAIDANGRALSTHYLVLGGTLTQVIEFNTSTAYPVVADPTFSLGWAVYVRYNKAEVKRLAPSSSGATTAKAINTAVCGIIGVAITAAASPFVGVPVGGVCGVLSTAYVTSIAKTFNDAKKNGQCVEIQYAYITGIPVVNAG